MASLLMVNPHRRKKQSYLLNPVNPFETISYPAHKTEMFRIAKTGVFKKMKTKKHKAKAKHKKPAMLAAVKKILRTHKRKHIVKHHKKISHKAAPKRVTAKRKAHKRRKASKLGAILAKPFAPGKIKLFGPTGQILSKKGGSTMARRKSHKKHTRRNPFNLKGMTKGFLDTNLLIDGSLVAGGMLASKFAIDFAASKVAFLATPTGKLIARVGLGMGVLFSGKYIGKRYAQPLALGFIAPAVLDAVSMIVPANLLPAGGVQRLNAGYMPDIPGSTVSLEQGYMPDVAEQSFGFSE